MENKCVYCNVADNLNTTFTITLDDGNRVAVYICDEHAEDATVKSAKAKYLEKKTEIDDFIARAKELGLQVNEPTQPGKIATASVIQQPTPQQQAPQPKQAPPQDVIDDGTGMVVDSSEFDVRSRRGVIGTGGALNGVHTAEQYQNIDLSQVRRENKEALPPEAFRGKVKVEAVEGRTGQILNIPSQRVDGTGTTTIRIAKTTSDADLQRRTKQMARDTIDDKHPGYGPHGLGYERSTTCPLCKGKCSVYHNRQWIECPKCGGIGEIQV